MNLESLVATILILAILPITIILIWFFVQKAKHKERMSLIEKGLNITTIERKDGPIQDVLMWGLLAGGTGFGLLIAYILLETHKVKDDMILGILAMLFGGLGLICYYFIRKERDKKRS